MTSVIILSRSYVIRGHDMLCFRGFTYNEYFRFVISVANEYLIWWRDRLVAIREWSRYGTFVNVQPFFAHKHRTACLIEVVFLISKRTSPAMKLKIGNLCMVSSYTGCPGKFYPYLTGV